MKTILARLRHELRLAFGRPLPTVPDPAPATSQPYVSPEPPRMGDKGIVLRRNGVDMKPTHPTGGSGAPPYSPAPLATRSQPRHDSGVSPA